MSALRPRHKARFERIPVALIDVPAGRVRPVKPWRVETLRKEIGDGRQPQHPVNVVAEDTGRYTLVSGAARLAAFDAGGGAAIDARVIPAAAVTADERRLLELTENLNREPLTALERAEALAELKRVHAVLQPASRRGGDRRSATARAAANQGEIFSFSSEAAELTGLSRRAIEVAVAMLAGLSDATKARVRGSWIEGNQAALRALAGASEALQGRALDLLLTQPPQADSIADALALAEGRRPPTTAEKLFASTLGNWARFSATQRSAFIDQNEADIRAHAKRRGWL